jgi:acyl carrier protein
MSDLEARLAKCFLVIFPDLKSTEVSRATSNSMPAWDSAASIMLVNVIEEEFGIQIDMDMVPELVSFERISQYLQKATG